MAAGSPADLRKTQFHAHLLEIEAEAIVRWIDALETIPGVQDVAMHGNKLHATVHDSDEVVRHIHAAGERMGLAVTSIREITPSLEDIFVSVTGRQRAQ